MKDKETKVWGKKWGQNPPWMHWKLKSELPSSKLHISVSITPAQVNIFWTEECNIKTCHRREINRCNGFAIMLCDTSVYFFYYIFSNRGPETNKHTINSDTVRSAFWLLLFCSQTPRRMTETLNFLLPPSSLCFPPSLKDSDCHALPCFITVFATLFCLPRLLFNRSLPPWWTAIS